MDELAFPVSTTGFAVHGSMILWLLRHYTIPSRKAAILFLSTSARLVSRPTTCIPPRLQDAREISSSASNLYKTLESLLYLGLVHADFFFLLPLLFERLNIHARNPVMVYRVTRLICGSLTAFFRSETKMAEEYLRFVVCKTDAEIDLAKDRLRGLKPYMEEVG